MSSQAGERWWQRSPCAHLVLDATDGTVVDANETFCRWTGLAREQVIGTDFARLLPVGDRILWSTHCLPTLETSGRVSEVSVQVVGAHGVRRAAFLTAARDDGDDGDGGDGDGDGRAHVMVALFGAAERRRYEEDLLEATRRAEASEAQRARAEAGLQHLVHHDPVTGLLNRSGLQVALRAALVERAERPRTDMGHHSRPAVLFLDLDGFKAVNDSVGHAGGDELLREVATRLRATARREAVVARFAGDEFVVVEHLDVSGDAHDVEALCQRLLEALAVPVVVHDVEVVVSASVGVAVVDDDVLLADPDAAVEVLLKRADTAMYRVKGGGRSGWHVHDSSAPDTAADRLRLLEQLRHAVTAEELRLHYQPRVRLSDGATTGVEALVRWQHPKRGLLAPAHFIDIAETSGLVREVGAWVLEAATAQAAAWNADGRRLQMGVNISARQLADPELLSVVTTALARYGVPASQLVLEITETALMLDPDVALTTLSQLHTLGVQIAVDDFGTGYASLTYLRSFPVDELKIDRSFVNGMIEDAGDRAIVTGCVWLARALGLVTVAEGVETAEQRAALLDMGCDVAQGYYFSKPLPASELFALPSLTG